MPTQPSPTGRPTVPLQHAVPPRTAQHLRDERWRTLIATYRLLSRIAVEKALHRFADAADELAGQAALIDEDLEHLYPVRWPRRRAQLLLEQADWWLETHDADVLACTACQLLHGIPDERIDVPRHRRIWA